ncbi:hypothetical protein [Pseudomonas farris]
MLASVGIFAFNLLRTAYAALLSSSLLFFMLLLVSKLPFAEILFLGEDRMLIIVGILVYTLTAIVTLRALVRTFPLRADLKPRYVIIGAIISTILLCFAPLASLIFEEESRPANFDVTIEGLNGDQAKVLAAAAPLGVSIFIGLSRFGTGIVLIYLTYFLIFILIFPLVALLYIHIRRRTPRRIILFLRRFGGPADVALMSALMRAAPKGAQVALIASPGSKTTSWDPMILIFAGFRWMRPWSNLPVYLRSSDAQWKDNVAHWISLSDVIVFDGSDFSVSMAAEWAMIKSKRAEPRTIVMSNANENFQTPIKPGEGGTAIEYRLSWLAAIRRLLIGSFILAIAGYFAFDIGGVGIALLLILVTLPTFLHRSLATCSILELKTIVSSKLCHSQQAGVQT